MAETPVSAELNNAIQEAVRREIARLRQEAAEAEVQAAGIRIGAAAPLAPLLGQTARYIIYYTAVVR
jgi:hypothetical protein